MAKAATPDKTTKPAPAAGKLAKAAAKPTNNSAASASNRKATPAKSAAKGAAPAKAAPAKKAGGAKEAPADKKAAPATHAAASKPASANPPVRASHTGAPAKKPAAANAAAPSKATPNKKAAASKSAAPNKKAAVKAAPAPKRAARKPATVICPLSGFEVKPDKPNLSPRTIERLEVKLLEERDRHMQQAEELAAEAEQLAAEREGGDTQFDEESGEGDTVNIERERDLLLSASARQIVDEVDRALERIKNKTYGLCVPAGRRISLERLEALPYAETCVDCKARAERRR